MADAHRAVRRWLWIVFGSILAMVLIGGITRLTGSGLSMVEWHPLMGAIPPLSDEAWREVFGRYQESPQYLRVNHWMGLEDFKAIFFWEYLHRLFGRLIGAIFALPWLYFLIRRRLDRRLALATAVAFVLGGAQGLLGWYMVRSGLVDVPAVSHYRLAAHLMLAFVTAMWVLWVALELRSAPPRPAAPTRLRAAVAAMLGLTLLQIVYGAFMAGKRAGLFSATFPDMNGEWLPGAFFTSPSLLTDLLENPAAIHYIHRIIGYALTLAVVALWLAARRHPELRRAALALLGVTLVQATLGVLTVVFHVPTWLAVAHQGGAFVMLALGVWLAYEAGLLPRGAVSGPAVAPE